MKYIQWNGIHQPIGLVVINLIEERFKDYITIYGCRPKIIWITQELYDELKAYIEEGTILMVKAEHKWQPKVEGHLGDYQCCCIMRISNDSEQLVGVS